MFGFGVEEVVSLAGVLNSSRFHGDMLLAKVLEFFSVESLGSLGCDLST